MDVNYHCGFLISNADILFSLVGRVFHGDDWTFPQRQGSFSYPPLLPLEVEWLISLL
jgi:hypothetical protein